LSKAAALESATQVLSPFGGSGRKSRRRHFRKDDSMIKVFQTRESGGNCFACCVASLLELDLESVPNFHQEHQEKWVFPLRDWLKPMGLFPLVCQLDISDAFLQDYVEGSGAVYIAGGITHRHSSHACIYRGGELLHDPHPDGQGLKTIEDMTFLVPIVPGRSNA
jgi:hypothetical protein